MKKLKKYTIDELEQSYQTIARQDLQYYVGGSGSYEESDATGSGDDDPSNKDPLTVTDSVLKTMPIVCPAPEITSLLTAIRDSSVVNVKSHLSQNSSSIRYENRVVIRHFIVKL
jgi:hypothetical protein